MNNYLDILVRNYPLENANSDNVYSENNEYNEDKFDLISSEIHKGGATTEVVGNDIASGGFPPIYLCNLNESNEDKSELELRKKEKFIDKKIISIKEIMEARRKKQT